MVGCLLIGTCRSQSTCHRSWKLLGVLPERYSYPLYLIFDYSLRIVHQGTWQFMSCKLISKTNWCHGFVDDLESTIYVLLWVTLVYGKCPQKAEARLFMRNVLDPQPICGVGGYSKADFLIGKSFLKSVKLPGRDQLVKLLLSLAFLFAVRYETNENDIMASSHLFGSLSGVEQVPAGHELRMKKLVDHEATITIFNEALADRSQWPLDDKAVKQAAFSKTRSRGPASWLLKTKRSTAFVKMGSDYRCNGGSSRVVGGRLAADSKDIGF
jgi:hypothetical protein